MSGLRCEAAATFQGVLRQLIHCLERRFPVPSTSFDIRRRRKPGDSSDPQEDQQMQHPTCSVTPVLVFITFPHNFIHFGSIPNILDGAMKNEVLQMAEEIRNHRIDICNKNQARRQALCQATEIETVLPISLTVVFRVLDSHRFPLLWKEFLKATTIMPTTVCCEQSFSVIKHTKHVNMKPESFIANATNKRYERAIPKQF